MFATMHVVLSLRGLVLMLFSAGSRVPERVVAQAGAVAVVAVAVAVVVAVARPRGAAYPCANMCRNFVVNVVLA